MDRTKPVGLKIVFALFAVVAIYVAVVAFSWGYNYQVQKYQKGEAVTIISNITEIKDGQVCQKVDHANVSYTGEKDKNWFRSTPGILGFPSTKYYVIKADSTKIWVDGSNLEKFDPLKIFCSPLPQK